MENERKACNRQYVERSRLIVIKIGSAVLTKAGQLNKRAITRLGKEVIALKNAGRDVVIVSSGAVASGLAAMGLQRMPRTIVDRQAAAAIGQQTLMNAWSTVFARAGIHVAQVLLTADDINSRGRYLNARHTLQTLLARSIVPVVNENDSVSYDEIRLGDNDHLSALVTTLISADLLIMLTDVEGLRSGGPHGELIRMVLATESAHGHIQAAKSETGIGGMKTKVDAAVLAGDAGVPTIIAGGRRNGVLSDIFAGRPVGTLFAPRVSKLDARRRWIASVARPEGTLIVDSGASEAIVRRNASLLPSGILAVDGRFSAGAVVKVCQDNGQLIARGLASYASDEVDRIRGHKCAEIALLLGYRYMEEVVHRDDLVVLRD